MSHLTISQTLSFPMPIDDPDSFPPLGTAILWPPCVRKIGPSGSPIEPLTNSSMRTSCGPTGHNHWDARPENRYHRIDKAASDAPPFVEPLQEDRVFYR